MISFSKLKYIESGNFFLVVGFCVIEGWDMVFEIVEKVVVIIDKF